MVSANMEIYNGTHCVYIHTNMINGKKYVGQTIYGDNPNRRWQNGYGYKPNKEHTSYFWNAIKKYGWDNFEHKVVASNLTLEEANRLEELLIEKLMTRNPDKGYNIKYGGHNKMIPIEIREKISQSHIGIIPSEETRKKMSESHKGAVPWNKNIAMPEEFSSKMRESKIGKCGKDANRSIKVYSPELDMYFDSMKQAGEFVGVSYNLICLCCNGRKKHAGRHPITQELLTWQRITEGVDINDYTRAN